MDTLNLAELRKRRHMSGDDFTTFIHKKFHTLTSPNIAYSVLHSLERDGLIKGMQTSKKRVYKLTDKGKENIKAILKACEKIQSLITAPL